MSRPVVARTLADLGRLSDDPDRRRLTVGATSDLAPLVLRCGAETVTVVPGDDGVRVEAAERSDAGCIVEFADADALAWFLAELTTVPGAQVLGHVTYARGGYAEFDQWEPALRALLQARAVFDPDTVDRSGLDRTFTADDPDDEIAEHFARYGVAVIRDVYTPDEIAAMNDAVDALIAAAEPGTPHTWWTKRADGSDALCQYHYTGLATPVIGALDDDPRTLRFAAIAGGDQVPCGDAGNGHFVVQKHADATEGLTDLTWHIDCGLGGHGILCPSLHVGIQLTASDPSRGAFSIVAGTHDVSVRRPGGTVPADWPVVTVHTEPGDVTLHATHALHAAPHPTGPGPGRRTLYLGFKRPEAREWLGPLRSFDDYLFAPDGHVRFDPLPSRS